MSEFIVEYWQFFVAGLILLALIAYWITDRVLAKKSKAEELKKLESMLEETETEETTTEKAPVLEESPEQPTQEETEEPKATVKKADIYTISYDKDKKDWVVKKRGNKRATKRTKTKKEALDAVKTLTENQNASYVVKKKDGKFQKK